MFPGPLRCPKQLLFATTCVHVDTINNKVHLANAKTVGLTAELKTHREVPNKLKQPDWPTYGPQNGVKDAQGRRRYRSAKVSSTLPLFYKLLVILTFPDV
jgi:hypothetical protein